MNDSLLVGVLIAGGAAVLLQVSDAVGALVDAATVRDSDEPDALTRRRGRELFWMIALTAVLAVVVAYGVDRAARLAWGPGAGVLLLTALAAFAVGCVGVLAVLRRERPTYARLRRDLRDRSSSTGMEPTELEEYVARLDRADRVRTRRPQAALVLRILGVLLVVACAALAVLDVPGWLAVAVAAIAVHVAAFVVALRASAVRRERLEDVLDAQRDDVLALLERARIPQRASVPGLRDRVTRALAILREKQR
ncbi:hypothetical protein [Pseudolysinimonas sp.]